MRFGRVLSSIVLMVLVSVLVAPVADAAPTCAEGPQTVGTEIIGTPCADTIRAPRTITVVRGEGGDDVIYGQRGNDTLYGGEGNDRLYGGVGDDFLRGGPGDDRLSGGFGADSLDGEAGNDLDRGDATVDRIGDSGGGTDTLSFATGVTPGFPNQSSFFTEAGFPPDVGRGVYVDLGQNFANDGLAPSGGGVDEPLAPATNFANFEIVVGTPFDDYIVGTSAAQTFYGGGGADYIDGGGGADVAYGGAEGDACVVATAHECESTTKIAPRSPTTTSAGPMGSPAGGGPALFFSGTSGKDEVTASYASGQVSFTDNGSPAGSFPVSEAPDSLLMAGLGGDDTLTATSLPESTSVVLLGGEEDDHLTSGATEDADIDGAGDDVVSAGAGDDAVPNNGGADRLDAGAGEDLFIDNEICGGDRLDGGPDRDNANWANYGTAVSLDLAAGDGGLVGSGGAPSCQSGTLTSLTGLEDLEGTSLADTMVGDGGDNQLLGRLGADTFHAGAGNDTILANSGTPSTDPDTLIDCGPGFDTAEIDRPAHGPDPAPSECETVEEREPNSFRPPDTPPATPDTSITAKPPALTRSTTAEFAFTASPASGATFECSLDEAAFAACTSPRSYTGLAGNGAVTGTAHAFRVRAVNAGGTDASPAAYSWTIDTVKPTATITGPPPNPSGGKSVAFAFGANEPSTYSCALEGPKPSAAAPCSSGVTYSNLPDGSYTFKVAATDRAGNVGEPASYTWRVENSVEEPPPPVPDTVIGQKPPALTNSTSGEFSFTATPTTGASFECSFDAGAFAPCSSPVAYEALSGGGAATGTSHTFRVRAKNAGGTDPTPASYTWTIDTVRPTLALTDRPPDPSTSSNASFSFSADEPVTFACNLSGVKALITAPCTSPVSYPELANGRYTFELTATDAAGNAADPILYHWQVGVITIPTPPGLPPPPASSTPPSQAPSAPPSSPPTGRTPPQTRIAAGAARSLRAGRSGRRRVVFRFSSDEAGDTFVCRLDRGPAKPCVSPRAYVVPVGAHIFRVVAVDPDGDADPTPALLRFRVIPPKPN